MAQASTPSANEPAQGLMLVHTVKLKYMTKAQISERMVSSGVSDIAFISVYSEKTHLNKLMIFMNKSIVFSGHQKLTSDIKLRPEK